MPQFGERSLKNLESCHLSLQELFQEVVKEFDCSVLCGRRTKEEQNRLYDEGRSRARYPQSRHNFCPSLAVDVAPYPIDWNDKERFYYFGGFVKGVASRLGIPVRWGGRLE